MYMIFVFRSPRLSSLPCSLIFYSDDSEEIKSSSRLVISLVFFPPLRYLTLECSVRGLVNLRLHIKLLIRFSREAHAILFLLIFIIVCSLFILTGPSIMCSVSRLSSKIRATQFIATSGGGASFRCAHD
jgi:hypothetical protein